MTVDSGETRPTLGLDLENIRPVMKPAEHEDVVSLIQGTKSSESESVGVVKSNLPKGLPDRNSSHYLLLLGKPMEGDPYFYLGYFPRPIIGESDDEVYSEIREIAKQNLIGEVQLFAVRRGIIDYESQPNSLNNHGKRSRFGIVKEKSDSGISMMSGSNSEEALQACLQRVNDKLYELR